MAEWRLRIRKRRAIGRRSGSRLLAKKSQEFLNGQSGFSNLATKQSGLKRLVAVNRDRQNQPVPGLRKYLVAGLGANVAEFCLFKGRNGVVTRHDRKPRHLQRSSAALFLLVRQPHFSFLQRSP